MVERAFEAARRFGARSLGIAGGVSANGRLRDVATSEGEARDLPVLFPTLQLSPDNAAMIAAAGLLNALEITGLTPILVVFYSVL